MKLLVLTYLASLYFLCHADIVLSTFLKCCEINRSETYLRSGEVCYHIHFTSFSSYNGYKLNSYLTCFRWVFIAQLVEHIASVSRRSWVRIQLEPKNVFWAIFVLLKLLHNCFTRSLSLLFFICSSLIIMIFIIYTLHVNKKSYK